VGEPREGPVVLVTNNPPPSLLARIDPEHVVGVACEQGAGTGHVAVLARALNLPALIQVEGLLAEVREGDYLVLDAESGQVTVRPDKAALEKMRVRERRRRALLPPQPVDPRAERFTADGQRIFLRGNAGSQRDVDAAAQVDADGIGLYRTEFLYLSRNRLPTESDLVSVYSAAARSFARDPVDIRLLDLGSDKHLPGTRAPSERNPALGLRSLRFLFANPEILRIQIRAVLQAAADGPVRLLLPMVASVADLRRVRETVAECHEDLRREGLRHDPDLSVGAMIEHPAGFFMAAEIIEEADFVSIGTNDLTMYLLAVDRDAAHLAGYYDPLHPAVIRALREISAIAAVQGKQLSVCGEIASDPSLTGLLLGLGLRYLSMAPQWILPVGMGLASIDAGAWRELIDEAVRLSTTEEIRKKVREFQMTPG
jgi:phosphotransferase system enzyme I (PtsI)